MSGWVQCSHSHSQVKEESGKYKDNQILDCVLVPTFDQVRRRRKRESTFDPVKLEDGQPHGLFNNINEHNASLLSHERVSQKTLSRSDGVVKVEQRMASSSTHKITLQSEEGNGNGSALSNHVPRVQYTTNAQKHSSVLVPQTILQLDHSVSLKGQGRPAVRVKELSPEIILSFDVSSYSIWDVPSLV
ncbi:hypothetical protein FA15DRAFT_424263 [Coprinopsis marcescibilis]|uniref:Uncharacterized protein n=1 Tax=Coprinopsis marcescibilis TaxID=230819 RepID=A0A5C3KV84_COPMA|nr:hypothetical protein FA15DRAFT_424263 [Coprinopsis marcescibilis]